MAHVHDGDTVTTTAGDRIRIIGLDAPEMGRDGRSPEPLAIEARNELRRLLFTHEQILGLRYDTQRTDSYQRLLAHAFLADGTNVAGELLGAGLATLFTVPPNLWSVECYRRQESLARESRRGIWDLAEFQVTDTRELRTFQRGYRLVRGRVIQVQDDGKTLWLQLEGGLMLGIQRDDLAYFAAPPAALLGETVEARGMIYRHRGHMRMKIRHPAALQVVVRGTGDHAGTRQP